MASSLKLPPSRKEIKAVPYSAVTGSTQTRPTVGDTGCLLVDLEPKEQAVLQRARDVLASFFQSTSATEKAALMKAPDAACTTCAASGTGFSWVSGKELLNVRLDDQSAATCGLRSHLGSDGNACLQQAVSLLDGLARKVVQSLLPEAPDVDVLLEAQPPAATDAAPTTHAHVQWPDGDAAGPQPPRAAQQPQQAAPLYCSLLEASCYPARASTGGGPLPAAYDWVLDPGLLTLIWEDAPCLQVMGTVQQSDSGGGPAGTVPMGPGRVAVLAGYTLQRAWGVRRACWYRAAPHAGPGPHVSLAYHLRARPDALLCPGRIRELSVQEAYHEFTLNLQQYHHQAAVLDALPAAAGACLSGAPTSTPYPAAAGPVEAVPAAELRALTLSEPLASGPPPQPSSPQQVEARVCPAPRDALNFQLFVHCSRDGRTRKYEVHPLTTVGQLRQHVRSRLGDDGAPGQLHAPPPPGVMTFAGRQMDDDRRLLDYGILPESTIHLVAGA